MPDYIKRIQSRLSSKGLKLSRPEISIQLTEEVTEDNIDSIVESFLAYQPSSIQKVTFQASDELANTLQPSTITESSLLVTDNQKEALVIKTSQSLGITLISSEVKAVSQSIGSQFQDRRQMLEAVTNAITAYTRHVAEQEQEIINEALNSVQNTLSDSNKAIANTFNNLENQISQSNLDFKSIQDDILSLFAVG